MSRVTQPPQVDSEDPDAPVRVECRVVSRVKIPVTVLFDVLRALNENMTRYEQVFGEIRRPEPASPHCCPKCQRPAQRLQPPGQRLPRRRVVSWAGEVQLAREKWRCTTCRVVFFPPG